VGERKNELDKSGRGGGGNTRRVVKERGFVAWLVKLLERGKEKKRKKKKITPQRKKDSSRSGNWETSGRSGGDKFK